MAFHRQADKTAVRLSVGDPLGDLTVEIGGQQLKFDLGVQLLKTFQDIGHPFFRHTGECGHPHKTGVQPPQVGGLLLQLVLQGTHLPEIGQQRPPVRRQGYAAVTAHHQRGTQLRFQRADGVTDAGLGKVQLLGSAGKAAALRHLQQDLIFGQTHAIPPCFCIVAKFTAGFKHFFMKLMKMVRFTNGTRCAMI